VLRDDPSGLEAALGVNREGRLVLVGPAEGGQGSIGQREAPSLGGRPGRGSRRPREELLEDGDEPEEDGADDFHGLLLSLDD
jgi:hypothetical protein